ncbi:DNA polymerase beta domain-containing protein region/nucleotidyltransferase family protein [Salinarchaeum sp. Harcht-Bsk1]|uniref:nucleotidyltransferase domain-containing protein n=1 Tax=Salinarchaeum sp. Harcht-Bsk1 TaxID=1333523 RepID=UPI0003422CCD|nr:nucleotidyltransferase domain-containing protein [Salinarchaeum sp. Harcht-Bsk1]AGN01330.1 DNA polymerase beta domain-containing protein region/nucleotidyltransferase family protein [Salinarchaeum sp. Harcht-Bsk1]
MSRDTGADAERGLSVTLPVPLPDDSLFGLASTDAVIEYLARNRTESIAQTDLADRIDSPESSVQRAVDVLAANDLVEVRYEGNRKLVRINRSRLDVPDDPYLEIPQAEFQAPVRAAVGRLRSELDQVVGIVLYGSVANGTADRRSDVDLWVVVRSNRAANQRAANEIVADLEAQRFDGERYAFHVAVESTESLPAFTEDVRAILRAGIVLHETDEYQQLHELLRREQE